MLDDLIENPTFRRFFPPVAATGLIVLFVSLGFWQLDRAAQKNATRALFVDEAPYTRVSGDITVSDFQNLEAVGRFDGDRQVLIDNMIVNERIGFYIITPFRYSADEPLLLVNRGWVAKQPALPDVSMDDREQTIRGRAGKLPAVGIRRSDVFANADAWPRIARYPSLEELSHELGEPVLPFILLLDPEPGAALLRDWQPRESGPGMHYGYAFQWFAMATGVSALLAWWLRRQRKSRA